MAREARKWRNDEGRGKLRGRSREGVERANHNPNGHGGVAELCVEVGERKFTPEAWLDGTVRGPVHEVVYGVGVKVLQLFPVGVDRWHGSPIGRSG